MLQVFHWVERPMWRVSLQLIALQRGAELLAGQMDSLGLRPRLSRGSAAVQRSVKEAPGLDLVAWEGSTLAEASLLNGDPASNT